MQNEGVSSRNMRCLLILMVLCGAFMSGVFTVAQDSWIAVLAIGVLFLPVIILYGRICALFPGKGIFEIIEALFGRLGRIFFQGALSLYALSVTALLLRNFVEFTVIIALQDTPRIPLMIFLLLTVLYLSFQSEIVLGRWSFIICVILVSNLVLTFLLALNLIDVSHIQPVMEHSLTQIGSDAFTIGVVVVGETVMLMALFGRTKREVHPFKIYIPGVLTGLCLLAFVMLRNLLILGADMEQAAKFSTYMAVRVIHIGSFFERIESSISFTYVLLGITKMSVFLSAASMGAASLMKVPDHRRLLVPVALIVLLLSAVSFKNIFELFQFFYIYRYWALPFQLLIPLIIGIVAEIKAPVEHKTSQQ